MLMEPDLLRSVATSRLTCEGPLHALSTLTGFTGIIYDHIAEFGGMWFWGLHYR